MCQSLKQRLGKSNIQARLGRPVGALMRGGPPGGRGGMRGMNRGGLRGRGRGGVMRGALSLRGMHQQTSVSTWILMASFKLYTGSDLQETVDGETHLAGLTQDKHLNLHASDYQ